MLCYEETNALGVLIIQMESNADHAYDYSYIYIKPIPPLCNFIGIERETVNASNYSESIIPTMPAIRASHHNTSWIIHFHHHASVT